MGRSKRQSTEITKHFTDILNDLVAETMDARSINNSKIAAEMGISKSMLSAWLSDSSTPTWDNLIEIAKYFNVSIDYLLGINPSRLTNPVLQDFQNKSGLSHKAISFLASNKDIIDKKCIPDHRKSEYDQQLKEALEYVEFAEKKAKKEGWNFDKTESLEARKQDISEEIIENEQFKAELILSALNHLLESESELHILRNLALFLGFSKNTNQDIDISVENSKKGGYFAIDTSLCNDDFAQVFLLNAQKSLIQLRMNLSDEEFELVT